ncbi:MAG: KpsF/GutQ family sugar-phosphate isomerase [Saprospiraceae bacterium]|nr:KpsF/GutQ family sugar-phosphate isomerase [Saprospiraceae bacterium]MBK6566580.1 KpsF/GutQ family sugar-phosphate isomerase [Saprospiraceae bacterium]MBK7525573.1 KpsF/GutQ family sugar-phosphate isomerase [Saprospiraceae bacterium]MBK8081042.1 KpsF/GutQ family sugar-phosphate isomerase [Saprospiraceae bacterium]MBK8372677.1 KpsF/GutQ family sugar-phosphate isomerase [Saprospiraceae bacterium]
MKCSIFDGFKAVLSKGCQKYNKKLNHQKIIREKITHTLQAEADALQALCQQIDDKMVLAVELIFSSSGRVIVTGIGKSAIVAQKMVATFNSTGTNAIYMHAADAIHGDLGMIAEKDVVICLSKSGNSPEIKVLIPMIKAFGNIIIGLVSHQDSFLYKEADYPVLLPMDKEADPNNLAPTTSTTLQMAVGDAMAVALLSLRGFSKESFARFHPGGSIGKQIYLKVSDIYKNNEKPKVYLNDNIKTIIVEISKKRLGITVVTDDNENMMGVITDGDLRRMLENTDDLRFVTAAAIMNEKPKTIDAGSLAADALGIMRKFSISQLVVVDGIRYAGIVHIHDLIREGIM